jgi:hypothetical protein
MADDIDESMSESILECMPTEILFTIFDNMTYNSLYNLISTNKNMCNMVRTYFKYNKLRYKNIKLYNDPTYINKKELCLVCNRHVKVSSKRINSPKRRILLNCCGKRYIVLHHNCFHKLLMTIKCGDCGYVFKPDSVKNVVSLNKIKKFQYNVDFHAFIIIYLCLRSL